MRLIDADALKFPTAKVKLDDVGLAKIDGYHMAIETVRNAPTVDTEPVVHARWKKSDIEEEKYRCSACGGACWYYDYKGEVARSRYCPNCGAKMDGGDADA